jgi:predicted amidophosphoribosyltransferase
MDTRTCPSCSMSLAESETFCPLCALPMRSAGAMARPDPRWKWILIACLIAGLPMLGVIDWLVRLLR